MTINYKIKIEELKPDGDFLWIKIKPSGDGLIILTPPELAQIRQEDLSGLLEWLKQQNKESYASGEELSGQDNRTLGYNSALKDFITKVESLNQDTK